MTGFSNVVMPRKCCTMWDGEPCLTNYEDTKTKRCEKMLHVVSSNLLSKNTGFAAYQILLLQLYRKR